MTGTAPVAELDARFSAEGATATPWTTGRQHLADAELYWLSTVRPDGRPHVTPLLGVWLDDALYFCTGETERKARNLAQNPHCVLTTGTNALHAGIDMVVEGDAVRVRDDAALQRVADAYEAKYGEPANVFAAQAYDGVQLVAQAISASGGDTSGEALAEALEGLGSYQGVNGDFRYTAEDHSGLGVDAVAISEWDGRRFVPARDGLPGKQP